MSRTAAEIIKEFREIAAHPEKAIANHKRETGKGAVGIMPVYCPEEIVHASGYLPIGMWGGTEKDNLKSTYLSAAICLFHHAVYYGIADGRCL